RQRDDRRSRVTIALAVGAAAALLRLPSASRTQTSSAVALIEDRRWSTALLMRRLRFDAGAFLLIGLELVLAACSAPGSAPVPTPGAGTAPGWVLVQVPKDVPPDTYPPIE